MDSFRHLDHTDLEITHSHKPFERYPASRALARSPFEVVQCYLALPKKMCEIFIPGERGDVHQSEIRAHIRDEETRVRRYLREFFSKNFLLINLIRIELKAILKVRTSCTRSHSTKVTYAHFVPALESVRQFLPQMAPMPI